MKETPHFLFAGLFPLFNVVRNELVDEDFDLEEFYDAFIRRVFCTELRYSFSHDIGTGRCLPAAPLLTWGSIGSGL